MAGTEPSNSGFQKGRSSAALECRRRSPTDGSPIPNRSPLDCHMGDACPGRQRQTAVAVAKAFSISDASSFSSPPCPFRDSVRRHRREPTVYRRWAFVLRADAVHVVHRELLHPAKRTTRFLRELHRLLPVGERAQRVSVKEGGHAGPRWQAQDSRDRSGRSASALLAGPSRAASPINRPGIGTSWLARRSVA